MNIIYLVQFSVEWYQWYSNIPHLHIFNIFIVFVTMIQMHLILVDVTPQLNLPCGWWVANAQPAIALVQWVCAYQPLIHSPLQQPWYRLSGANQITREVSIHQHQSRDQCDKPMWWARKNMFPILFNSRYLVSFFEHKLQYHTMPYHTIASI